MFCNIYLLVEVIEVSMQICNISIFVQSLTDHIINFVSDKIGVSLISYISKL